LLLVQLDHGGLGDRHLIARLCLLDSMHIRAWMRSVKLSLWHPRTGHGIHGGRRCPDGGCQSGSAGGLRWQRVPGPPLGRSPEQAPLVPLAAAVPGLGPSGLQQKLERGRGRQVEVSGTTVVGGPGPLCRLTLPTSFIALPSGKDVAAVDSREKEEEIVSCLERQQRRGTGKKLAKGAHMSAWRYW
jgi:hypothetical protein